MNNLVFSNTDVREIILDKDTNIIINEFIGNDLKINIKPNVNGKIFFFTKSNQQSTFDLILQENAKLTLDLILMNDDMNCDLNCDLVEEYAELNINVLSLAKNATKKLNVNVKHLAPETKSNVTNYGISFENGKNHFNVTGMIKPNMKNSDVKQITRGLILSPTGECIANPILLIDYYDVKAYHGATIGKVSDDDLFYLMSRGLSKDEAFMLIINGLLEPFIREIDDEIVKNEIMKTYNRYFTGE